MAMIRLFPLLSLLPLFLLACQSPIHQSQATITPTVVKKTSNSSSKKLNAGIRQPLLRSEDFGQTWIDASQGLPSNIQVSFLERKGEEILIATDNMGIFLSQDNRTKWKQIGADLASPKINALHISGNNIYVGVYRQGIFKTDDDGEHWTVLNYDLPNLNVQSIWLHKDTLLAGTDDGIFSLVKKEHTWQATSVQSQTLSIYEHQGVLVAGTSQGSLIAEESLKNWRWIRQQGAVHYTHKLGKRIVELALNGDVVYSDDWGQQWTQSVYQPRKASYVYEIIAIDQYLLMSNNYGIHRSIDNAKTWKLIYPTELMAFFDFLVIGQEIYGGTRTWDEYRNRN